ncbi:MAG: hypothetical protein JSV51_06970 [Candidatus Bathyarchaeota archaeon]|nr:MAG: hypothetical protein JSV51_06970 [Candidatus Bathyarchaeota archaeon]
MYDSNNQVVDTATGTTSLGLIMPNRTTPFIIYWNIREELPQVEYYHLTWTYEETEVIKPEGLVIVWTRFDPPTVRGEIFNEGNETATFIVVVATFYDENKIVIGASADFLQAVEAGDSNPFQIDFPFTGNVDLVDRLEYTIIAAESRQYIFRVIPGNQNSNNDPNMLFIIMVILLVSIVAIISSALILWKRKNPRRRRKSRISRKTNPLSTRKRSAFQMHMLAFIKITSL